ncbi:hypothetical protein AHAS_Ahas17G0192900 [Arachis hypogaea]
MLGENDEGNETIDMEVQAAFNIVTTQHPFGVPFVQDDEFAIGIEFSSREAGVMEIRNYTISKGVDYRVYEFELLTFYAKCL